MSNVVQIERDRVFGFTARVTREDGAVSTMTDGGTSRSLESFFPKAVAWLRSEGAPESETLRVSAFYEDAE